MAIVVEVSLLGLTQPDEDSVLRSTRLPLPRGPSFIHSHLFQAYITFVLKVQTVLKGLFLTIWMDRPNCCTRRN